MRNQPTRTRVAKDAGVHPARPWTGARATRSATTTTTAGAAGRSSRAGSREAVALREERRTRARKGESLPRPTRETFEEVAAEWLAQATIRPRTREWYEVALRLHVNPRFGRVRLSELSHRDIEELIADMQRVKRPAASGKEPKVGYAGWTIRGTITVVSRVLAFAVDEGKLTADPMDAFRKRERRRGSARKLPKVGKRQRVLSDEEVGRLLDHARPLYRPLLATAALGGLRLGELLALTWADVDFGSEHVHVGMQMGRDGKRVPPKTETSIRDVDLDPVLAAILREQRRARHSRSRGTTCFAGEVGTPMSQRNVERRGLDKAADEAGLNDGNRPRLRVHDLRHTFASGLIHDGLDPDYVAGQLGFGSFGHVSDLLGRVQQRREGGAGEGGSGARSAAPIAATAVLPTGGVQRRQEAVSAGGQVVEMPTMQGPVST